MFIVLGKVLPLLLIFALGVLLKRLRVFSSADAHILLKLFFYVSLPALILLSIPALQLEAQLLLLPLSAICIIFASYLLARFSGRFWQLERRSFAVLLLGSMIMNGGFAFPFVLSAYGDAGMALAALFDFGAALVVFTFVYFQACRYGGDGLGDSRLLGKFLLSPPLWALLVALALNLSGTKIGGVAGEFLQLLANLTTPVVLLALGIVFQPRLVHRVPLFAVLFTRMVIGLGLGLLCAEFFSLQGLSRAVVLVMASAPCGMNTLVFSSMEQLDNQFAASIVSYATLLGLFWLPLVIAAQQGFSR